MFTCLGCKIHLRMAALAEKIRPTKKLIHILFLGLFDLSEELIMGIRTATRTAFGGASFSFRKRCINYVIAKRLERHFGIHFLPVVYITKSTMTPATQDKKTKKLKQSCR